MLAGKDKVRARQGDGQARSTRLRQLQGHVKLGWLLLQIARLLLVNKARQGLTMATKARRSRQGLMFEAQGKVKGGKLLSG